MVLSFCLSGQQNQNMAPKGSVAALILPHQHHAQPGLVPLPDEHPPLQPVERLHADAAVGRVVHGQRLLPLRRPLVRLPLPPAATSSTAAGGAPRAAAAAAAPAAAQAAHQQGLQVLPPQARAPALLPASVLSSQGEGGQLAPSSEPCPSSALFSRAQALCVLGTCSRAYMRRGGLSKGFFFTLCLFLFCFVFLVMYTQVSYLPLLGRGTICIQRRACQEKKRMIVCNPLTPPGRRFSAHTVVCLLATWFTPTCPPQTPTPRTCS